MIKEFLIVPVKEKKSDKSPDYSLINKTDDGWNYFGVAWKKQKDGKAFLSVVLNKEYEGKAGYSVVQDKVEKENNEEVGITSDDIPF